jgi:lipid II:glycine glycyltransferase (peptidoglycan interpeptide bridge formation enzyme)
MITIINHDYDQALYNSVAPHPMQAWQWGEARHAMGLPVIRLGEFENEQLKNVFQFTVHKIPGTPFKLGYLPRSVIPSEAVFHFLFEYGKKHNLIFIKIEPQAKAETPLPHTQYQLIKSPHPLFPEWTQVLDLTPSEEDLLKNMKQKTRYNVRLAQKKGVTVTEMSNEEGFKIFSKLYFETTDRQHYYGHTHHYHKLIWEHMQKGIAHILIGFYENTPLVAYELFSFNNKFYYPYGGSSDLHRNVMAANAIMWEAILLGKKLGATEFDMWGSLPPTYDEKDPWAGFTRFKEGYGSQFVQMIGSYDLIISPASYHAYSVAHKLRSLLLTLKKKYF